MHGLIFETSICYWQDQPDNRAYRNGKPPTAERCAFAAAEHRELPAPRLFLLLLLLLLLSLPCALAHRQRKRERERQREQTAAGNLTASTRSTADDSAKNYHRQAGQMHLSC